MSVSPEALEKEILLEPIQIFSFYTTNRVAAFLVGIDSLMGQDPKFKLNDNVKTKGIEEKLLSFYLEVLVLIFDL